ncbi:hypothetical protein CERSUDRAFT_92336 [Gelatoporia subvermispora B]|uniref:Zn(2)-C6 fungal-type domain-containing protein n=1 Tax=Ceriporiopsis subvermispora (strain B) TaxID=914234 RepID=M2R5H9_CERS8|nr:hypothetical protein CERSUDRAFT_92336 [Gelatoporia subvermispora B]
MAEESGRGRSALPRSLQGGLLRRSPEADDEDDRRTGRPDERRSPYVIPPFPPPPPTFSSLHALAALGSSVRDEGASAHTSRHAPQPRAQAWAHLPQYTYPAAPVRTDPRLYASSSREPNRELPRFTTYTWPAPAPLPPSPGTEPAQPPPYYATASDEEYIPRGPYVQDVGGRQQYARGTQMVPMQPLHEYSPPRGRATTPRMMTQRSFTPTYTSHLRVSEQFVQGSSSSAQPLSAYELPPIITPPESNERGHRVGQWTEGRTIYSAEHATAAASSSYLRPYHTTYEEQEGPFVGDRPRGIGFDYAQSPEMSVAASSTHEVAYSQDLDVGELPPLEVPLPHLEFSPSSVAVSPPFPVPLLGIEAGPSAVPVPQAFSEEEVDELQSPPRKRRRKAPPKKKAKQATPVKKVEDDDDELPPKVPKKTEVACDFCRHRKLKCGQGTPCSSCLRHNKTCRRDPFPRRRGPGKKKDAPATAGDTEQPLTKVAAPSSSSRVSPLAGQGTVHPRELSGGRGTRAGPLRWRRRVRREVAEEAPQLQPGAIIYPIEPSRVRGRGSTRRSRGASAHAASSSHTASATGAELAGAEHAVSAELAAIVDLAGAVSAAGSEGGGGGGWRAGSVDAEGTPGREGRASEETARGSEPPAERWA